MYDPSLFYALAYATDLKKKCLILSQLLFLILIEKVKFSLLYNVVKLITNYWGML